MNEFYYILVDGEPVPTSDLFTWGEWFETADRNVAKTEIGETLVSTVFLGLDHSFGNGSIPILFETLVFGGGLDGMMDRYATLEDAMLGHERMVARVRIDKPA